MHDFDTDATSISHIPLSGVGHQLTIESPCIDLIGTDLAIVNKVPNHVYGPNI